MSTPYSAVGPVRDHPISRRVSSSRTLIRTQWRLPPAGSAWVMSANPAISLTRHTTCRELGALGLQIPRSPTVRPDWAVAAEIWRAGLRSLRTHRHLHVHCNPDNPGTELLGCSPCPVAPTAAGTLQPHDDERTRSPPGTQSIRPHTAASRSARGAPGSCILAPTWEWSRSGSLSTMAPFPGSARWLPAAAIARGDSLPPPLTAT